MGAQDLPAREGVLHVGDGAPRDPLGERPLGLGELLGLDGAEVGDRLGRRGEPLTGQPLLVHAPADDCEAIEAHGGATLAWARARAPRRPRRAAAPSRGDRGRRAARPRRAPPRGGRAHRARERRGPVDPGSWVEYGRLAIAAQRQRREHDDLVASTPADGLVAGTARIDGRPCAVLAYDYTVLAGHAGPHGAREEGPAVRADRADAAAGRLLRRGRRRASRATRTSRRSPGCTRAPSRCGRGCRGRCPASPSSRAAASRATPSSPAAPT